MMGQYDGVASIEMFEAVGEEYWPAYFGRIASMLKAGGRAALQIITIGDAFFENYRRRADFIQRYIFPRWHAAERVGAERAVRPRACAMTPWDISGRIMRAR